MATAKALILRKGAVRSRELVEAGVARAQLSRLVASGDLIRLSRGIYTVPENVHLDGEESVLVVAERWTLIGMSVSLLLFSNARMLFDLK